jgi:glycosyltransferase involved in cell wall biosynthesis
MPSNNKITVAIPVYNGRKYILEALQSIVNQTVKVDNIIVCDNKSTDDTKEIVNDFFSKQKDINCKLHVNESNLGYQRNFNRCMEICQTEYLLLLAADDRLKPKTIEVLKNFMDNNPEYALAGGYADSIDEQGKTIFSHKDPIDLYYKKGEILEFLQQNRLFLIPSSVLMRMAYIREVGFWDLLLGPDERYWPKVIQHYPIAILKDCIVERRLHNEQTAIKDYVGKFSDVIKSLKENLLVANYESTPERIKSTKKLIYKQNSSSSLMMGNLVIKYFDEYKIGFKYLMFSVGQSPSYKKKISLFVKASKIFLHGVSHSSAK